MVLKRLLDRIPAFPPNDDRRLHWQRWRSLWSLPWLQSHLFLRAALLVPRQNCQGVIVIIAIIVFVMAKPQANVKRP